MSKKLSPTVELDQEGKALLRLLVHHLPTVKPGSLETYLSYKDVHDRLKLKLLDNTYSKSLQNQGLDSLAKWVYDTNKPGITGLIIDRSPESMMPGKGYFKQFGRPPEDFAWWRSEIEKSKDFNWEPYLSTHLGKEDLEPAAVNGEGWSIEELRAAVLAYLEMFALQRAGSPFTKKKYYSDLSDKFGRTPKSFEYRMQNISYVLSLLGREWLTGLKPAKNVGANVAAQIEQLIYEAVGQQANPVVAFEIAVREDMKKDGPTPSGSRTPKASTSAVTQFQRDSAVKAWVLKNAKGKCECCDQAAPFHGADGFPYLEVHHIRQLADKGSDTVTNAIALCPNCHREMHYGSGMKELAERLYQKVLRLIRE